MQAGPAIMLYKAQCEGQSSLPSAFVLGGANGLRSGAVYFREARPERLRAEKAGMKDINGLTLKL